MVILILILFIFLLVQFFLKLQHKQAQKLGKKGEMGFMELVVTLFGVTFSFPFLSFPFLSYPILTSFFLF